ncbi:hypothetical protein XU18_5004 [Perkinsela sp. CCAP 1560/4]|nr:hypothetical protein XU18_5004 [Perkinsela sp. CCAP 1560/4]|eukprot:KNH03664.1 hypothetical protein XU18_5004 [Perkinsela sp. CCAP 1560/4]
MASSCQNSSRWLCQVCGKEKDLSGPHLSGKTSVRSDCWPCATKRKFVLTPSCDTNTPKKETEKPSNPESHSALSDFKNPFNSANSITCNEKSGTDSLKGFQFNNCASENETAGFFKLVNDEKQNVQKPGDQKAVNLQKVDTPSPVTTKETEFQWLCAVCQKPKDLAGPHLLGKESVRSDCWPCATKRKFVKTPITTGGTEKATETPFSKQLTEKFSTNVLASSTNSMDEKPSVSSQIRESTKLPESSTSKSSKVDIKKQPCKVLDSLVTPGLPDNFNPFESSKAGKLLLPKETSSVSSANSFMHSEAEKPATKSSADSNLSGLCKQPFMTSEIKNPFTKSSTESNLSELCKQPVMPSEADKPSTNPSADWKPISKETNNVSDQSLSELRKQISLLEKRVHQLENNSVEQKGQISKKISGLESQTKVNFHNLEQKLKKEHDDVQDLFMLFVGKYRKLSDMYLEGLHDLFAMILKMN